MKRIAGAGALVLIAVVAGASQAAAAGGSSWKLQPIQSSKIGQARLAAISCGAVTTCMAVGTERAKSFGFAELWNGSAWKPAVIAEPSGANLSGLQGVSCLSASACTVVGYSFNTSGNEFTLAERWNGSHWSIESTPSPGVYGPQLFAVSCPTSTSCTAVGSYQAVVSGPQQTLVEHWNGTAWSVQTSPNVSGSTFNLLTGVACTSASSCIAVGYSEDGSGSEHMLAEGWNGTVWSIESTPYSSGLTEGNFNGVSCTSATACTAVGNETSNTELVTLVERWNGQAWAIQSSPSGYVGELEGVSCTSATACTATGMYEPVNGPFITLAERWNGTSWAIKSIPSPKGGDFAELAGVSCVSASSCEAAGYSANSGAMSFNLAEGNDT
jgi:hypothetical protein